MPHIILTKDVYLKKALSVILQQVPADRKLCIIDIESFRSLGAIFNILKRKLNLSPKTIYTYTYKIGIKMNLCSILQLRQFIYSEFKLDKESLLDCSFPLKIKSSHSPLRSNPLITPIGLKSLHTMPHDCGIEIISCCSFA